MYDALLKNNDCYKSKEPLTPKGLMLHSIGSRIPHETPDFYLKNWNKPGVDVCVHAFIDVYGDIYQTLPWTVKGWHCCEPGNSSYIGVEMCEPKGIIYNLSGTSVYRPLIGDQNEIDRKVERTFHAAADLFSVLCERFKLNPHGNNVIISHAEGGRKGIASAHADPEHLWFGLGLGKKFNMGAFRDEVFEKLNHRLTRLAAFHIVEYVPRQQQETQDQREMAAAQDIIQNGDKSRYGNGQHRIEMLRRDGLDPNRVQNIINNILEPGQHQPQRERLTYDQVAEEIIVHDNFGRGEERIRRLRQAGYNDKEINIIQGKINRRMKYA